MPLSIVVIGSGVAGLAATAVLRPSADVKIIERGNTARISGGQGISLGPNAVKILDSLGWDREKTQAVVARGLKAYDATSGKLVSTIDTADPEKWGADWTVQLRSDFRNELVRLATEDGTGKTTTVLYETKVADIDTESGTVTREDGQQILSDVIIIAAGIHSTFRDKILGNHDIQATPTGQSIFRFLVSAENAFKAVGRLHEWWDPEAGAYLSIMRSEDGTNRAIIAYPSRNFEYVNFSCAFPNTHLKQGAGESWFQEGNLSEVLEIFKDFPSDYQAFIQCAEEIKVWELRDHDPLPTYVQGRAVLIGDAAHAMPPFQGQGAGQAVEDAEGLSLLLDPGVTRDYVPRVLQQWDSVRRPRASQVQLNARLASRALNESNSWKNMEFNWTYDGIRQELQQGSKTDKQDQE